MHFNFKTPKKKKKIGQSSHPSLICSISGKMSYFFSAAIKHKALKLKYIK